MIKQWAFPQISLLRKMQGLLLRSNDEGPILANMKIKRNISTTGTSAKSVNASKDIVIK